MNWVTFVNRVESDSFGGDLRMPLRVQEFLRRSMPGEVDGSGRWPFRISTTEYCSCGPAGCLGLCGPLYGGGGRRPDSTFVEAPYASDHSEDDISVTGEYVDDPAVRSAMINSLGPFLLEPAVRPSRSCRRGGHGYVRGRLLGVDGRRRRAWPGNYWSLMWGLGKLATRELVIACRERMQLDRQQMGMETFQRQMYHHRVGMEANTLFHRPGYVRVGGGVFDHELTVPEVARRAYFRSHPTVVKKSAGEVGMSRSPFRLLDARYLLSLVVDFVPEDDALCLALSCRVMRDTLWARFQVGVLNVFVIGHGIPPRDVWILDHPMVDSPVRIRTRDAAILWYPSRIDWALGLSGVAWPLGGAGAAIDGERDALSHCRLVALLERRNRTERDAPAWRDWKMIAVAAGVGALDGVRRLRELGYGWNSVAFHAAAGGGHLPLVMYLHAQTTKECVRGDSGLGWGRITTAAAAAGGHLAVLEYLIDVVGCPWDSCCAYLASYYGRLDVLVWLESRWNDYGRYVNDVGCGLADQVGGWQDPRYCALPRRRRFTPALHGPGGSQMVCAAASLGGHLAVLRWARGTDVKVNRRPFAWNRDYCLSFASVATEQGESWFGGDRPGFDHELCDHAVYAAFSEHHVESAIVRWIVQQPVVHLNEVYAEHAFRCDEPEVYRCASAFVVSARVSFDRGFVRFGALFGSGGWRHLDHASWVGIVAGFDQREDVAFPYASGHNG